jgi:hypothetical protein
MEDIMKILIGLNIPIKYLSMMLVFELAIINADGRVTKRSGVRPPDG